MSNAKKTPITDNEATVNRHIGGDEAEGHSMVRRYVGEAETAVRSPNSDALDDEAEGHAIRY